MARRPAFQTAKGWAFDVSEMNALATSLTELAGGGLKDNYAEANRYVVTAILDDAKASARAQGRQEFAVADDPRLMFGKSDEVGAQVFLRGALAVGPGGQHDAARWAIAAEFGVKSNKPRRIKHVPGVIKGQGKIKGRKDRELTSGGYDRIVQGWNQLGDHPWRGSPKVQTYEEGPGYFFWPAIRRTKGDMAAIYSDGLMQSIRDEFARLNGV